MSILGLCNEALEELEELKAVWANSADTRIDRWLRAEVMGLLEVEPELAESTAPIWYHGWACRDAGPSSAGPLVPRVATTSTSAI